VNKLARELQKRLMVSEGADRDYNRESEEEKEMIDSKFADFSVSWSMASFIFVGQFALFLFFVLELNGDGDTHDVCSMNVFHWLTAIIVTNVAGQDESGEGFHRTVWHVLRTRSAKFSKEVEKYGEVKFTVQFWCRLFYAATINGFVREVLLCLAPVALSVVDRGDLVKDCLAIFFISQMDDLKESKKIDVALEEWSKEVMAGYGDEEEEEEERKSMEPKEVDARSTLLQQRGTPRAGVDDQRSNQSPRSPSSPEVRGRWEDPKQGVQIPEYGVHVIRDTASRVSLSPSPSRSRSRPSPSSPRFIEP